MEIPYQVVQTLIFGVITYFMMSFERNLGKIFPLTFIFFLVKYVLNPVYKETFVTWFPIL